MAKKESQVKSNSAPAEKGITGITVDGYKSISSEQSIEITPLTILAGANSSGKSSLLQPLLLLKQTLEASYDPGALLLNGPNVRFTSVEQILSRIGKGKRGEIFSVGIKYGDNVSFLASFSKQINKALEVERALYVNGKDTINLRLGMPHNEIVSRALPPYLKKRSKPIEELDEDSWQWVINRNRCFLELALIPINEESEFIKEFNSMFKGRPVLSLMYESPVENLTSYIRDVIHLPGLRGNAERTYPVSAVSSTFPGTFENYVASIITKWQVDSNSNVLEQLSSDLRELGLTWTVMAKPVNDTQVELQVGRLPEPSKAGKSDMVSIADVGVGVSQTLPVLVALHAAKPGQLVYIEQPEIHLHPRAQTAMAQILAKAAKRGVRVVVETHSSLLILGIQTLVAEGAISPELIKLHWFERRNGRTEITSRDLDETGAFGDWPEDFADVALEAQSRYLDAAESRMRAKRRAS